MLLLTLYSIPVFQRCVLLALQEKFGMSLSDTLQEELNTSHIEGDVKFCDEADSWLQQVIVTSYLQ